MSDKFYTDTIPGLQERVAYLLAELAHEKQQKTEWRLEAEGWKAKYGVSLRALAIYAKDGDA